MTEKVSKTKIYHEILSKKENLIVLKKHEFNFEFPKKAFDRICLFYGKLTLNPISFVRFNKSTHKLEFKKLKTISHVLGEKEIEDILETSKYFAIIPKNYYDIHDIAKISQISPKIKNKIMKDIVKKSGIHWDIFLDFCEIQIISTEYHETSKITISYEIVEHVFRNIPLLNVVFINGEKVDCTFYSYKKILENTGINLEKMIPYLKHETKNFDRTELLHKVIPLYEKVKIRKLKERIRHGDLKEQSLNIYFGANTCHRYNKVPFDDIENDEKEASNLLRGLKNKVDGREKDFSDINEKLLLEIIPQNKLILINDINNNPSIIKKKAGDNIIKYPKTNFDIFSLYDINGKKIKISKKILEKKVNDDEKIEFIEILNNTNDENKKEIVSVKDLEEALKDKEKGDFEISNNKGKKIKLNKKKMTIINQNNKYIDIPEQGEEIKNKLLSEITDSYLKLKDSKSNKDIFLRNSQLNEIINHKQKAPFINYEILNDKNETVFTTKDICNQKLSEPNIDKFILCYDENEKDKEFLIPIEKIKNIQLDGDDELDVGNNRKIIFKNLKIKKLSPSPKLEEQSEEKAMIEVNNLINSINSKTLVKNYKSKDINKKICFISNKYIYPLQEDSKNDKKNTKYKINDSLGNKIIINKEIIEKDNKPGEYIIINNKKENKNYIVDSNDLLNNLKKFKSNDDEIIISNCIDNKNIKLNPIGIEIISPNIDYPIQKVSPENNEESKNGMKERLRLRSMPMRFQDLSKKKFIIRRAVVYRKKDK